MMKEYKRYDEYKDSGIEWIGAIPANWDIERFRTLIKDIQNGKWGEEAKNNSDDIYCVRVANYNRGKNIVEDQEFTVRNLDKASREELMLKKDDLLIEKSGGGDKQPVGFVTQYKSDKPAIYANFMAKIKPRAKYVYTDYLKYVNISIYQIREILKVINQTTGIQNLDTKRYLELESPLPSKQEQQKIASFLDQKTAEIDKIINKKERLIDYLEKYKKSVITEAVTKGKLGDKYINETGELVDEIEMKDSGVEWMGEIPGYWEIIRLKFLAKIKNGKSQDEVETENGKYPILGTGGEFSRANDYLYDKPSVLLGRKGTIDEPQYIEEPFWTIDTLFYTEIKEIILPKLFFYLSKTIRFDYYSTQTALPSMTQEDLNQIPFPLAIKINIQEIIINFIKDKIIQIDNLIQKTKESIEKYKEYKKTLIFEAVTGEIDLRDYQIKGGEEIADHSNSRETKRKEFSEVN